MSASLRLRVFRLGIAVLLICTLMPLAAQAGGGPFGMDHRVSYDDSGIWGKAHQNQVLGAAVLFVAGAALWEGDKTRFGHTMWQSADAIMLAVAGNLVLPNVFQREPPSETADPDLWFEGFGNTSFPSGHAMISAAAVTPVILEYGGDHPWVWALAAIPLYEGIGRVKTQTHWQSDVLAGWAIGAALGWYAHSRKIPLLISILPDGFAIGLRVRF